MIFLGLAAKFSFRDCLAQLFTIGTKKHHKNLRTFFAKHYSTDDCKISPAQVILYENGRTAISSALLNFSKQNPKIYQKITSQKSKPEVAITSFTCYAVYQAVVAAGFEPVFLDIDQKTLHFNASHLESAVKTHPNLVAVIVQNNLGIPVDIDSM